MFEILYLEVKQLSSQLYLICSDLHSLHVNIFKNVGKKEAATYTERMILKTSSPNFN